MSLIDDYELVQDEVNQGIKKVPVYVRPFVVKQTNMMLDLIKKMIVEIHDLKKEVSHAKESK